MLLPQQQGAFFGLELGTRIPVFDIRVTAQKSSPFSKAAQNELAKELYSLGFFRPDQGEQAMAALDMMDFEGREMVKKSVAENLQMQKQLVQMQQQLTQLARAAASSVVPAAENEERESQEESNQNEVSA